MEPRRERGREIILWLHLIRETGPVRSRRCCRGSTGRGGKEGQEEEEQRGRNRNDKGKRKIIKGTQRDWRLGQATLDTFSFYPQVNVKSPGGNTHCFW